MGTFDKTERTDIIYRSPDDRFYVARERSAISGLIVFVIFFERLDMKYAEVSYKDAADMLRRLWAALPPDQRPALP